MKDLHFRVFDNPPVIDILEAIAGDLLLCWAATPIRILDGVGVCMRVEPALFAKGVPQGDLRTVRYLWCHQIKVKWPLAWFRGVKSCHQDNISDNLVIKYNQDKGNKIHVWLGCTGWENMTIGMGGNTCNQYWLYNWKQKKCT